MSIFFLAFVLLTFSLEFLPLSHVQFLSVRSYLSETLSLLHKSISDLHSQMWSHFIWKTSRFLRGCLLYRYLHIPHYSLPYFWIVGPWRSAMLLLLFLVAWHWSSIFFPFIFISRRLITLQYCSGFCYTLTWISHGEAQIFNENKAVFFKSKFSWIVLLILLYSKVIQLHSFLYSFPLCFITGSWMHW